MSKKCPDRNRSDRGVSSKEGLRKEYLVFIELKIQLLFFQGDPES
jgi:hypothetical protein